MSTHCSERKRVVGLHGGANSSREVSTLDMLCELGIRVFDTLSIPSRTFEEFMDFPAEIRSSNALCADKHPSTKLSFVGWMELITHTTIGVSASARRVI